MKKKYVRHRSNLTDCPNLFSQSISVHCATGRPDGTRKTRLLRKRVFFVLKNTERQRDLEKKSIFFFFFVPIIAFRYRFEKLTRTRRALRAPCARRLATVPRPAALPARPRASHRAVWTTSRTWRTTRTAAGRTARSSTVGPRPGPSGTRRTDTCRPTRRWRAAGWARGLGCRGGTCSGPSSSSCRPRGRSRPADSRRTATQTHRGPAPSAAASRSPTGRPRPVVSAARPAKSNTSRRLSAERPAVVLHCLFIYSFRLGMVQ